MEGTMDVLHPRCAGLDVHKDSVVAAVRLAEPGGVRSGVRRFDTTTPGLLALGDWLAECGCTHAVMQATGVYWKPVWHVLGDGDLTLVLANAAHVRSVPGRKTDVADAAWLADLLAHGLVRASFVPDVPTQAMRALLRTRKQLVREQSGHVQRLQKTLEDANLKLASVLTDTMGLSGPPRLLGWPVSPQRRERGQAPLHAAAPGRALAEDHPRPVRLGGQPQEGRLPPGAVPAPSAAPPPEEGGLRRRRLHLDRHLAHAARRHRLPRPRGRPLPQALPRAAGPSPRPPDRQARLHLLHRPHARRGFCLGPPRGRSAASPGTRRRGPR